jgi:GNAT superfamily N-acetyltransferase
MMLIARLTPRHAAAYRALMLEAYTLHPAAFTSSADERSRLPLAWWEQRLSIEQLADEVVLGAFENEALAGVAGLSFEKREKVRHKATLFGMYVPARSARQGLGRRLLQSALQCAREQEHVLLVQLTVTRGNAAAQSLYERSGFTAFGIEPCAVAVGTAFVDKVHMWCNLRLPADALRDHAKP